MVDRNDLRRQFTDVFEEATYPVSSPMDLVPVLPNGLSTRFESGEFSMTALELRSELSGGEFPYEDVDPMVDDLMEKLEANDLI